MKAKAEKQRTGCLTVIVVPGQVLSVDKEIMILVELPELAVDDVEVLVAEEVRHL